MQNTTSQPAISGMLGEGKNYGLSEPSGGQERVGADRTEMERIDGAQFEVTRFRIDQTVGLRWG